MLIKKIICFLIRLYQWLISPILPSQCRFEPSCSHYAIEAIEEWGVFRGFFLIIKRVFSCHPGFSGGKDPVPRRKP